MERIKDMSKMVVSGIEEMPIITVDGVVFLWRVSSKRCGDGRLVKTTKFYSQPMHVIRRGFWGLGPEKVVEIVRELFECDGDVSDLSRGRGIWEETIRREIELMRSAMEESIEETMEAIRREIELRRSAEGLV